MPLKKVVNTAMKKHFQRYKAAKKIILEDGEDFIEDIFSSLKKNLIKQIHKNVIYHNEWLKFRDTSYNLN